MSETRTCLVTGRIEIGTEGEDELGDARGF